MASITGRMWQLLKISQLQISEPIVRTRSVWIELLIFPAHLVVKNNVGSPRKLSLVHGHKVSGKKTVVLFAIDNSAQLWSMLGNGPSGHSFHLVLTESVESNRQ